MLVAGLYQHGTCSPLSSSHVVTRPAEFFYKVLYKKSSVDISKENDIIEIQLLYTPMQFRVLH